jgi:LysM repeat protein
MSKVKTLISLCILVFAVPSLARAGLNVYPADGPAPTIHVEPPKPLEYKVQKGDTVAVIAKKFSVDAKTLMSANGMSDPRKLQAGKTLQIPGKTAPAAPVAKPGPAAAPVTPAAPAVQAAATAAPAPSATPVKTVTATPPPPAKEIVADAKGRRSGRESVDPGVEEDTAVRGKKKGKRGKAEPALPPPPTIEIDAKTRASFGKSGVIMNTTDVPQAIRDEFYRYAIKWLDELETLGVGTYAHKKIHQVGSQWEATYRIVMRESLGAEVKRVHYEAEDTPYVGHITYVQRVYTSVGPTKQAALAGPYTQKDEAIREIFSYSGKKKAWR